jgi:hypothetical protein
MLMEWRPSRFCYVRAGVTDAMDFEVGTYSACPFFWLDRHPTVRDVFDMECAKAAKGIAVPRSSDRIRKLERHHGLQVSGRSTSDTVAQEVLTIAG